MVNLIVNNNYMTSLGQQTTRTENRSEKNSETPKSRFRGLLIVARPIQSLHRDIAMHYFSSKTFHIISYHHIYYELLLLYNVLQSGMSHLQEGDGKTLKCHHSLVVV